MVFFKIYTWATHSFFSFPFFLKVLVICPCFCTLSEVIRTFLWKQETGLRLLSYSYEWGKILIFNSWVMGTFRVWICVGYTPWTYWLLVEGLKTLEVDVLILMLSWGWLKMPYYFVHIFLCRVTCVDLSPDFCSMCEEGLHPETCIFSIMFWLCWKLVLCCHCGQTQALVPHWIN